MFRLIVVLAIALFCSQIPALFHHYLILVDDDLRAAMQSGAPEATIAELKRQRTNLIYADPMQYPFALIDAWDTERALATVGEGLELRLPEDEVEWAYGGVGLVAGFLVTGILFAPFRQRLPAPARQAQAPTAAPARKVTRAARPKAATTATKADQPSPWGRAPEPAAKPSSGSRIPASGGSLVQAAARLAREVAREAGQAARDQVREQGQPETSSAAAAIPRSGRPAIETRYRRDETIVFSRDRPAGTITMSYARPPLIARRRVMSNAGPIERVTVFRD